MATQRTSRAALQYWQHGDKNWDVQFQTDCLFLDTLPAIGDLQISPTATDGLTYASLNIAVGSGWFLNASFVPIFYTGTASFGPLVSGVVNYIYLTDVAVLTSNTTGFPTNQNIVKLATVTCGITSVTSVTPLHVAWQSSGALNTVWLSLAAADTTATVVVHTGTTHGVQIGGTSSDLLGFHGATPTAQQANTAGAGATASGTYGATEQKMIQDTYSALRAKGLLS